APRRSPAPGSPRRRGRDRKTEGPLDIRRRHRSCPTPRTAPRTSRPRPWQRTATSRALRSTDRRPPRPPPGARRKPSRRQRARTSSMIVASIASRGEADRIRPHGRRQPPIAGECLILGWATPDWASVTGSNRIIPEDVRAAVAVEILHVRHIVSFDVHGPHVDARPVKIPDPAGPTVQLDRRSIPEQVVVTVTVEVTSNWMIFAIDGKLVALEVGRLNVRGRQPQPVWRLTRSVPKQVRTVVAVKVGDDRQILGPLFHPEQRHRARSRLG